jgi:hypothetical protein
MIEPHGQGIAAYCHPHHKVSLGLLGELHNKIGGIQRSACAASRKHPIASTLIGEDPQECTGKPTC